MPATKSFGVTGILKTDGLDPEFLRRATRHLRGADPVLERIIGEVGVCRWRADTTGNPFAALVEAILSQQITGKAAAKIHGRLRVAIGRRHPRPEDIATLSDDELRAVGLSRQKSAYLRDLAHQAQNGLRLARCRRLEDEAVIAALVGVKGIGRWTAEMFLMFRLGRHDVLPVDDYGIRKAMQRAYRKRELPKADWMRKKADPWRPYRTVACWYLWRSLET
jgi:3-methyladenine DNA glycosylase/8-oxoguanine DNA glycosylase